MLKHIIDDTNLISEWDYEKNNGLELKPEILTLGSGKKAWWRCANNHSWFARIDHRHNGVGCPYCSGLLPIEGVNDLATKCKESLEFWDYAKNGALTPSLFLPNSEKKVWWKCLYGHNWESTIATFSKNPSCPYCGGKKLLYGVNDLETNYPSIAAEWDHEENSGSPRDYFKSSNKTVSWKCLKGHKWKEKISARTAQGLKCPYCSHKRASEEYNLLRCNPDICSEWDYSKNGSLNPAELTPHSNTKVWWKCKYGHSWNATINHRTGANSTGCPICKKYLQTSFPEQAVFYYIKCYSLMPSMVINRLVSN